MMIQRLSHFLDIRTGEAYRVGVIASLLFFLIAANNLIKIIRDTVFLSHHPVSELPYLYIVVAIVAGVLIALYGRYISNLPVTGLILVTNAIVILNIIFLVSTDFSGSRLEPLCLLYMVSHCWGYCRGPSMDSYQRDFLCKRRKKAFRSRGGWRDARRCCCWFWDPVGGWAFCRNQ